MAIKINTPPKAEQLIESLRSMGYTFKTALADIIDNSLSAGATAIDIELDEFPESTIFIIDNGRGMNRIELQKAMTYGSGNPKDIREESDLGRFGLGLKSASLSQCAKLIVASKTSHDVSAFCWDLEVITHELKGLMNQGSGDNR